MTFIKNIYCDFDGTITKTDTVNVFFEMFADKSWLDWEALWIKGEITSRENAIKQVSLVKKMQEKTLNDYIESIEIDDYFVDFYEYTKKNNLNLTILSDGFDLFIEKTLQKYGIKDVKFYSNHLIFENNSFRIEFPNNNPKCDTGAGMCKCNKVNEQDFCYIGDGTSDLCIAQKAKILFATKRLKSFCADNNIRYFGFENFRDIIDKTEEINSNK